MSAAAPSLTHRQILPIVRGVSLCILLAALDQTIIVPALPRMAAQLGGGHALAWAVAAYLLTGTAATPIFGSLSDRFGRRRLLRPALLIFVAASLGCALAQNFVALVACRAVQGIGGAGLITMAQTVVSDVASPRERGRYQIYMSGMWGIASLAGPVMGGALTDLVTWRAIFWINLPLGLLAFWASERALPVLPVHAAARQKIDVAGALLLTASITCGLLWISALGQGAPPLGAMALGLLAGAAGLTALTLRQEARVALPMLPLRLFGNGTMVAGLLLSLGNALCTFGASFLLPLFFQYQRHTDAARSGLFTTPFLLAFVVMSYFGGRIARRLGRTKPTMLVALLACLLGLVLLATMGPGTALPLCWLYMALLGGGIGLVQPNITVAIQSAVARPDVGVATGCMLLFRGIGGAVGATLASLMLLAHGFAAGFAACAVVAAGGVVVVALMRDAVLRG